MSPEPGGDGGRPGLLALPAGPPVDRHVVVPILASTREGEPGLLVKAALPLEAKPAASSLGASPRVLKAILLDDFLSAGVPDFDYVVEPILAAGSLGLIVGSPGTLKSWLGMDLGLAVASGEDWLGVFKTKQGPVLYVDQENPRAVLERRLAQLREARGCSSSPFYLLARDDLSSTDLDLTQVGDFKELKAVVDNLKPALVILDSLREFHSADENSSTEMAPIMRRLKALASESGAAVLAIHHLRKDVSDLAEAIRGTGHFRAAVDAILGIVPDSRNPGCVLVKHLKTRYPSPVGNFQVQLVDEPGGGVRLDYLSVQPGPKIAQAEQAILAFLQSGPKELPVIVQHVAAQVKCDERTVKEAKSRLAHDGKIVKVGQTRPAVWGLAGSP